jgi:cyclophilin family peptidyl-prolyl cis-trans isomerase
MHRKGGRWLSRFPVMVVAVILLGACSGPWSDDDPTPTPEQGSMAAPGDPALVSRCWTTDQRTEGDDVAKQYAQPPAMAIDPNKTYTADITTNFGTFTVEFFPQDAPNTVNNFICLANDGYYNNTPFHRIISGFMFQGGDPTGTGAGGPGYRFNDEPINKDYVKGTLAMANAGPNTNGSQFFVCVDNLSAKGALAKNYTIFGQVTDGMDVVDKIAAVQVGRSRSGEMSAPTQPVTLESVTVHEQE